MPVQILEATATGFYNAWTLGAGANKVVAVNSPDDDTTSYVSATAGSGIAQTYVMQDLPSEAGAVNTVTHRMRFQSFSDGSGNCIPKLRLSGTDLNGTNRSQGFGVWGTYTEALGRPGGGAWTVSDVNATEAGVVEGGGGGDVADTSMRLEVDYVPATGGFAFLVAQWLGPLSGVLVSEIRALRDTAWTLSRGRLWIKRSELATAWSELRDARWRRYAL